MKSFRPICEGVSPELFREKEEKESVMTSVMGVGLTGSQATAAVFGINAAEKPPPERRDDVVAAIGGESTNGVASRADLSLLKMANPAVGQTVDVKA